MDEIIRNPHVAGSCSVGKFMQIRLIKSGAAVTISVFTFAVLTVYLIVIRIVQCVSVLGPKLSVDEPYLMCFFNLKYM